MGVFAVGALACGGADMIAADGGGADADHDGASLKDGEAILYDGGSMDAGDGGGPTCAPIPSSDAGTATQPCGKKLCDTATQYCEVFYSGIPMNPPDPPIYTCKQAPTQCKGAVTCACLKPCVAGNPFMCKDDAGAVVSVAGQ